jgi:hypothetical protein
VRPNSKDRGPVNSSKDRPRQLRDVFLSHGWILEADFPHTPRMQHCDAQVRAAAPARALRPIFVITSSVTEPEQEPNARHPPHPPTPLPTTHPTVLSLPRAPPARLLQLQRCPGHVPPPPPRATRARRR